MSDQLNPLLCSGTRVGNGAESYIVGNNEAPSLPSRGEGLRPSTERPRLAVRACDVCRQMKVKCKGFNDPPCDRCKKAGRQCLFRSVTQGGRRTYTENPSKRIANLTAHASDIGPAITHPNSHRNSLIVDQAERAVGGIVGTGVSWVQHSEADPKIPSIYSTSPLDALRETRNENAEKSHSYTRTESVGVRYRDFQQRTLWNSLGEPNVQTPASVIDIPTRDLRGMIKIFCEHLLPYIPALSVQDFQDIEELIKTEFPLVCCICFVTAGFLSGGKQLRKLLMPQVEQILEGKFNNDRHERDELSTMKALIILYGYATTTPPSLKPSETVRHDEIPYWPLKSLTEAYGLRLSLNRAVYDLRSELRLGKANSIIESRSYKRYTFWLQLFTMSKYASVVSGTPPSIPIDSTIRASPILMEEIGMNPQAGLFGEVELAIIWEKVGTSRQLGEWWCLRDPDKVIDEQETESILNEAEHMIDAWYKKWANYINDEDGRGIKMDYLGRCARFWISSYATRHLQSSRTGLTNIQKNQVHTCIVNAINVLDWPLNLSPFQKETLRYVPESGGVMVSYCCLYIVATCQTFGSTIPDLFVNLDKVIDAANLILEMAPDSEHNMNTQALLILKRVEVLQKELGASSMRPGSHFPDHIDESFEWGFYEEGMSALELIWDVPM